MKTDELSCAGWVRSMILKNHALTLEASSASDGESKLWTNCLANARSTLRKKQSPDDNQHSGPRAGKPEKKTRKPRKDRKVGSFDIASLELLIEAKRFVVKLGGVEVTRKLLDVLESIQA